MTSPVGDGFRIGRGVLKIESDSTGLRQEIRSKVAAAGAGLDITVPVRADTQRLWRDIDGRLRDERGRFAKSWEMLGRDSGRSYGKSVSSALGDTLGDAFSKLDFMPSLPIGPLLSLTAAAVPATAAVLALGSSLGLAASSAAALAPALLGAAVGVGTLMLAFSGVTEAVKASALGADEYAKALNKLSPAGRKFTVTLVSMKDELNKIRKVAETNVLPGFTSALNSMKTLLPTVTVYVAAIGSEISRAASALGRFIASPLFREQFKNIMNENAVAAGFFADSATPMARILTTISEAAASLVSRFAEAWARGAEVLANWLDMKRESGELARFFRLAGDELANWWAISKNVLGGIIGLFVAANPEGRKLSDTLRSISERFREWATSDETRDKIQRFFEFVTSEETRQNIRDLAVSIGAMSLAIKGMTIAGGVVGFFAQLGPWGLAAAAVAAGVAAIAAGFAYLYQHSETLRNGVGQIIQALRDNLLPVFQRMYEFIRDDVAPVLRDLLGGAFEMIRGLLVDHLLPAIREMYDIYLPKLKEAWASIAQSLKDNEDEIKTLRGWIGDIAGFIIDYALPAMGLFAGFLAVTLGGAISTAINVIGFFIDVIKKVKDTFDEVRDRVSDAVDRIKSVVETVFNGIMMAISFVLDIIKQLFQIAWDFINQLTGGKLDELKSSVDSRLTSIKNTISGALDSVKGFFSDMWKKVKDGWNEGWSWLHAKANLFIDGIKNAVGGIKDKFVDTIRSIPRGIVGGLNAALQLINRVIDKVNGFLPGSPVPHVGYVTVPEGYATGGMIRGAGTGTSDSIPIMASNGEFMLRARAVESLRQAYGAGFLDQLNRFDVGGDPSSMTLRRGYASGGLITSTQAAIRNADPLPYVWGAVGPSAYDCSGLVGQVWAMLTGHPSFRRYFTTANIVPVGGFKSGHGTFTIGLSNSHVVGNLAGLAFEAASSRSGIKVGASAKSVDAMPRQYYLPQIGDRFIGGGSGKDGFSLKKIIGEAIDEMASALRGRLPQPGGFATPLIAGIFDRALGGLKSLSFDGGGVLPPGPTLAVNNTRQNEYVLTSSQVERIMARSGTQSTYVFQPGSVSLDVSRIKSIDDLLVALNGMKQTARKYGATPALVGGAR